MAASVLTSLLSIFVICLLTGEVFSQDATVSYSLREERPIKTYVGSVALDSQLFTNISNEKFQKLQFQILTQGNKYSSLFYIEKNTSLLWTNNVIDREEFVDCFDTCFIDFNVAVYDMGTAELTKFIKITIDITDYNDNKPEFLQVHQPLVISESTSVGAVILRGAAVDLDQGAKNSVQTYVLLPLNNVFELKVVQAEDMEFVITLKNELDRETSDFYQLVILAKDGGTPELTGTLSLDITVADDNDNSPIFSKDTYNISIQENVAMNSTILGFSASDADEGDNGKVTYQFSNRVSNKVTDLFKINSTTGELIAVGVIDYETDKTVDFQIQAVDNGKPPKTSTADIHIKVQDVNDNSPVVNINMPPGGIVLSEMAEINTFVTLFGITDLDSGKNGLVSCNILDDNFRLQNAGLENNYKIVLNRTLDHDTKASHNVTIICQDSGILPRQTSTYFIVYVEDVNDNFPIFSEITYSVSIEENNAKGVSVVDVWSTDKDSGPNAQISYFLHPETAGLFIIDSFTGIISASTSLDRETHGDQIIFRVFAQDGGIPSKTSTGTVVVKILDQNDNDPIFVQNPITFHVFENQPIGTVVGNVSASDPDNGLNGTFYLKFPDEPDIAEYFEFLPETGLIKTNKILDRERNAFYEFYTHAIDLGGRTSSVLVTVYVSDENDNLPEIIFPNEYDNTIAVPYSQPMDKEVIQIDAQDLDTDENAKLYYYIDQDNSSYSFNLNLHSGKMYLNNTMQRKDIDRVFSFVIRVKDGGMPASTSWTTLNIRIIEGDATFDASTENTTHLWIVVVIVVVTAILSLIMVIIIIKMCWVNRREDQAKSNSSDRINESNKINPKLIDSSSSSTSSKDFNTNENMKYQDGCLPIHDGFLGNQDETGSILSADRHLEEQLYIQKVKELSYGFQRKIDETNSDNSGEMGTRDSGQGGSDVDINSLSELPVLDIAEMSTIADSNSVPSPRSCYLGSLNPNSSHSNNNFHSNHAYSLSDISSHSTTQGTSPSDVFIHRTVANFSQTPFKTAERKEISKLRRSQKRVMFSDDLENSHSSGRSSTMSFSDINSTVHNAGSPRRFVRLLSEDSSARLSDNFRSNDFLRRSVDNLDRWKNDGSKYNHLLGNEQNGVNSFGKNPVDTGVNSSNDRGNLGRNLNTNDWRNTSSSAVVYTIPQYNNSKSSSSRDTESTTTSGSYTLALGGFSSSPTGTADEVFA